MLPVNVSPVLFTVDGDTPDPHLGAGPEHSDGDLSPVGHQHLLDGLDVVLAAGARGEVGEAGGGGVARPPPQPRQVL